MALDNSKLLINRMNELPDKLEDLNLSIDTNVNQLNERINNTTQNLNEKITDLNDIVDLIIHPGDICYSFRTSKPGWLLCNGASISRTNYSRLFSAIGTTFGEGDGSTTFNLPNCSGKFLQMDTSKTIGSSIDAGLPDLQLYLRCDSTSTSTTGYSATWGNNGVTGSNSSGTDEYMIKQDNVANANKIAYLQKDALYGKSSTVQPPSIVCNYFIKY